MKKVLLALLVSTSAFAVTQNKVWRVPSGGSLPSWGPVNLASSSAITGQIQSKTTLPSVGQQKSSGCGTSYSNATSTFTDVTNLSVTITTTGRPVYVSALGNGSNESYFFCTANTFLTGCEFEILRDSTVVAYYFTSVDVSGATSLSTNTPPTQLMQIDTPAAGTYTYKIKARVTTAANSSTVACDEVVLMAYEL